MHPTPAILFIVFNRPAETRLVFNQIRQAKPKQLFIAADGPRINKPGEEELCKQTREITKEVDWDCEVQTLFRNENWGCGKNVSAAISWFFDHVEEGIILEDDCLPHPKFFPFCAELLERYRHDKRIAMVCGHNPLTQWATPYPYIYSKIGAIWGWASWKRAWDFYDYEFLKYEQAKKEDWLSNVFCYEREKLHRINVLNDVKSGKNDTWDYQWTFARLINNALSIIPSSNLVQNVGFGATATHTTIHDAKFVNQPVFEIELPTVPPPFVFADVNFDRVRFDTITLPIKETPQQKLSIKGKLKQKIKKIIYGR